MTTLQEAAMRKALELGKRYAKCLMMNQAPFDEALESLRTALAQQGEQQPVCAGCGIPEGDVHMSTCQSGKWPLRVSNGDTSAPAPQPDWLLKTTQDLAHSIRRRCFPEVPQFEVLDDLAGVISQIDNMTTGMERKAAESALQSAQPVAWTHSCNALCTDGLELWCDHCPHCGKPRTTHAEQWPPGLITDIVLTVTALHKEVDIGWSPDARSHLLRLSTSIGMLATTHPAPQPAQEQVGINGLTEAETSASMSVLGLSKPAQGNAELIARSTKVAAELDDFNSSLDRKATKCIRELLTALQSAQPAVANIQTKIVKDISAHEGGKQQLPPLPTTEPDARGCAYCNHPLFLGSKCKNCGKEVK